MKKMIKGFLMFLCMVSVFMLIPSQSKASPLFTLEDWTFDMNTTFGSGYGVWNGINHLTFGTGIEPNTYLKQELGDSGTFELAPDFWIEDGMTFQESVNLRLNESSTDLLPNDIADLIPGDQNIILGAQGLTGSVNDLRTNSDGENVWDFTFDPGGTIGLYLMNDTTYTNYATNFDHTGYTGVDDPFSNTLMELELIDPSSGTAPGFLGGTFTSQAQFGVSFEVTNALNDMFLDSSGEDLWTKFGQEGLLFASQTGDTGLNDPTFGSDTDGKFFTSTGDTGDKLQLQAVPEPTTLLLFGTGLLGLAAFGRKKLMRRS